MSTFEQHGFKPEKMAEQVKAEKSEIKIKESEAEILKRKEQLAVDTRAQESIDSERIDEIRQKLNGESSEKSNERKMDLGGMEERSLSTEEAQGRKENFQKMTDDVNKGLGGMAIENVSKEEMRTRYEEHKKKEKDVNKGLGGMSFM